MWRLRPPRWEAHRTGKRASGGQHDLIHHEAERDYRSKSVVKPISLGVGASTALMFKTDDPGVAASLPALAQAHGFEQVWLQTWRPASLSAAIQAAKSLNIPVRLAIRPWEVPDGASKVTPPTSRYSAEQQRTKLRAHLERDGRMARDESTVWGRPPYIAGLVMRLGRRKAARHLESVDLTSRRRMVSMASCCATPNPCGYETDCLPTTGPPRHCWTSGTL